MYPMPERRSRLWRLSWWVFWVVLIVYVVRHPTEAADNFRVLLSGVEDAGEAIVTFLQGSGGR